TQSTVLSRVREGDIWRVRIVWPSGAVRHFGKFASEKDAADWIAAHSRLTMPAEETSPPTVPKRLRASGASATTSQSASLIDVKNTRSNSKAVGGTPPTALPSSPYVPCSRTASCVLSNGR